MSPLIGSGNFSEAVGFAPLPVAPGWDPAAVASFVTSGSARTGVAGSPAGGAEPSELAGQHRRDQDLAQAPRRESAQ